MPGEAGRQACLRALGDGRRRPYPAVMGTLRRYLGGLAVVVALAFPGATARGTDARLRQEPCGVASSLPSPPTPRPHYVLTLHVLPGLRTVKGALSVAFTAPTERGPDPLGLRLRPHGAPYDRAGAHLPVSA